MRLTLIRLTRGFLFTAGIVIGASISWTLVQGRQDARNRGN